MASLTITVQLYDILVEAAGSQDLMMIENVIRNYMGLELLQAPAPHDVHATKYPFRELAVRQAVRWALGTEPKEEARNVKKYLNSLRAKYGHRYQTRVWMGCLEVTRIF